MTQSHGYWEDTDGRTVFFSDYFDVTTYSGVDTNFVVSMPWHENLEEEGFYFPSFVAYGTITDNVPTFTNIVIPEDRLTFLDEIDSYNIRNPYGEQYDLFDNLAKDFGLDEPEDDGLDDDD